MDYHETSTISSRNQRSRRIHHTDAEYTEIFFIKQSSLSESSVVSVVRVVLFLTAVWEKS